MILALEIGATNTRIGLVKGKKVLNRKTISTPKTKSEILSTILKLIDQYKTYESIGIGVAGIVKSNKILKTPNMNFSGVNLKEILEKKYAVSVNIENDAKCAALAEKLYGIGKKEKNFFLITLGTGIGGAQVENGKIISKEVGHMKINGKEFEDIASGTAAQKLAKKHGFFKETNEQIYALAKKNNTNALSIYKKIGNNLSTGLMKISDKFNPKIFVFSGGFSKVNYTIEAALAAFRAKNKSKEIKFIKTSLGEDIGLIGAASLVKNN